MFHVPDISKDFVLNKAVQDATNILLKPYMPVILSESSSTPNIYEGKYETMNHITRVWILNSQDFLLKMATIAWHFLNVFHGFPNNGTIRFIKENTPEDNILNS